MLDPWVLLDLFFVITLVGIIIFMEQRIPHWWKGSKKINFVHTPIAHPTTEHIPGPWSFPIIGTTWTIVESLGGYKLKHLHRFYESMHHKYGPIMKEESFLNYPIVSLFERSDIEKVLHNGGKYPLRPPCEAMAMYRNSRPDRYSSIGLVNEQGENWYKLRNALTPALTSPKTIANFLGCVHEIADDWCNLIRAERSDDGNIWNMTQLANRLGLEVTCALVLGRRMGFLLPGNVESHSTERLAACIREHFLATRDTYFGLPLWRYFPTPTYTTLVKCEETIYELVLELIESADDACRESYVYHSVISANVDQKEKTATLVDFMSAGIHTLKNSLLFLLHLIGENSDVQNRINDASNNLGQYTKACMMESFRLYPTANALARIIDHDMDVAGYTLKSGTVVVCHTGIACRDERNFPQANSFLPDRWLRTTSTASTSALITNKTGLLLSPFGAGKRICPGKRFIERILPIIVEHTTKQFRMTSLQPLNVQFEFLLSPAGSVPIKFKDR